MFFDDIAEIPKLAQKFGFTIFVLPSATAATSTAATKTTPSTKHSTETVAQSLEAFFPKNSILAVPVNPEKNRIGVDEIREISTKTTVKILSDRFIIIFDSDRLTDAAQNALLKNLEEPRENYHYIIFTTDTESLLPTILSRAEIFYQRTHNSLTSPVAGDEEQKAVARELLTADREKLIALANQLSDKKRSKTPRENALNIVSLAIEIAEKSYFATKNPIYLHKLEKLLALSDNLQKGGHIKLHVLADML